MTVWGIKILKLKKSFNGNQVVDIEELKLCYGKAYGLIGTNGSGKTTLLNLLAGKLQPDSGVINMHNHSCEIVHHESGLLKELKVYENVYLNREFMNKFGLIRWIDWGKVKRETQKVLNKHDLDIDAHVQVKRLDLATQKMLEIVIAISKDPDILIIDEPLALLDVKQIHYIGEKLSEFMSKDKILIYSSHRVDDMVKSVDKVITMRDGAVIGIDVATDEHLMSYWEFSEKDIHKYPKRPVKLGKDILKVKRLRTRKLKDIRFDLREGEILGIIGLKNSYKSDIGRALFGAIPSEGQLYLKGRLLNNKTTEKAVEAGICYIGNSEEGLFADDSIYDNVVAANGKKLRKLSRNSKKVITKYYLDLLQVGSEYMGGKLSSLSAGNKQKILLAKWFFSNSKIFIFNKPTANVDASSKVDIYNIFSDLACTGAGLIIISNDLEEIAGLCDRVLLISEGVVTQEISGQDLSVYRMVELLQNWN